MVVMLTIFFAFLSFFVVMQCESWDSLICTHENTRGSATLLPLVPCSILLSLTRKVMADDL